MHKNAMLYLKFRYICKCF